MPLLVSSLMMVLLGITAAACSPPLKWFAFSVACCFGGMVFASVAQCFRALYLIVPAYAYAKGAARCLVGAMGFAFVGGWLLFPLMFALGQLGAGLISRDLEAVGQFFGATKTLQPRAPQAATVRMYPGCGPTAYPGCGPIVYPGGHCVYAGDFLAKNSFVALGCVVKGQYLRSSPRLAAGAMIASSDTPGRFHPGDGAMTDDAMHSAQGARRAPPDLPAARPAPTPLRPRPRATPYATPSATPLRHTKRHAPCSAPCSPAELIFDDLSFRGQARRTTPAEQHALELRRASASASPYAAGATPTHLTLASPPRFQELLRAKSEAAGSSASGCRIMEAAAHSGGAQRATPQQSCEHAADTLHHDALRHDSLRHDALALEARPPRSASCRHNGARHTTPGTRPARPEEASIDGVGVNSQELLSALRLIAANPSVASALPPLERTTADRPSRPSRVAP